MTQPSTLVDRYQAFRTRRFLDNRAKTAHMLPRWRTRSRRRILIVCLAVVFAVMTIIGVISIFSVSWYTLAWLPATLAFLVVWTSLQVVSNRQSDAPAGTLDEWEVQQRDSARSIGLTITQTLVMIPIFVLIFGAAFTKGEASNLAYGGGLLAITALLIGGCSPAMILGWSRPDPEPEDLV